MTIRLSSSAFESGGTIPARYTCDGQDSSPPLRLQGIPDEAKSLALIMDDPDAPNPPFVHWVLYNISPDKEELEQGVASGGTLSWGANQGRNNFGNVEYGGPCPPRGESHDFYFRLYALDTRLDVAAGATRQQVLDAMKGHILDQTELMASYARQ